MDRHFIRAAYRALLGREPENQKVIEDRLKAGVTEETLLRRMVESAEFKMRHSKPSDFIRLGFSEVRSEIEVDVSPETMTALFNRIQAQWAALGETEPYFSVLTTDSYRMTNF